MECRTAGEAKVKKRKARISVLLIAIMSIELAFSTAISPVFAENEAETAETIQIGEETGRGSDPDEPTDADDVTTENGVLEKGADYTVFAEPDGSRTLEMYSSEIRIPDEDGELQDLDASLQPSETDPDSYTNVCGKVDVNLPSELTETSPIEVQSDGEQISFYPIITYDRQADTETSYPSEYESYSDSEPDISDVIEEEASPEEEESPDATDSDLEQESDVVVEESEEETIAFEDEIEDTNTADEIYEYAPADADGLSEADAEAPEIEELITKEEESLYHEEEEKDVGIRYNSPDPDVSFEYYPLDNGVKENIILRSEPSDNVFRFRMQCRDLVPVHQGRAILLMRKDTSREDSETEKGGSDEEPDYEDDVVGIFHEPSMTDSSDTPEQGYSEDLEYGIETIDSEQDIYEITLTVSTDYLEERERVYPVTIDPTYTANTHDGIKEVLITSKSPTTHSGSLEKMAIGYSSSLGVCRTYIKFPNLTPVIRGNYINSATFRLCEGGNSSPYPTVGVYRITESWAGGSICYNDKPTHNTTAIDTSTLTGGTTQRHNLDITKLVRWWAAGTYSNYGVLVRATTESSQSPNYARFYATCSATESRRPVLTVSYTVPSPSVPAKASSVTIKGTTKLYTKKNTSLKVSWSGIKSNILDEIQWRMVKYTAANTYATADVIYSYSTTGASTSSGSYTISSNKISSLADGKYAVAIRGRDKLGNSGEGKLAYVFLDGTTPVLTGVSLDHTSTSGAPSDCLTPKISWIASDAIALSSVNVIADNKTVYSTSSSGSRSYTFKAGQLTGTGNHSIKVIATDKAGNQKTSSTLTYYTNTQPPTITNAAISVTTSQTLASNNKQPVISFNVSSQNLRAAEVLLNDQVLYSSASTGTHSFQPEETVLTTAGCYTFRIRATSNTGITATKDLKYYYDGTAPVFSLLTITPDTNILHQSANLSPVIAWNISEMQLQQVSLSVNEGAYTAISNQLSGQYQVPSNVFNDSGRYRLTLRAEDAAGNTTEQTLIYYADTGNAQTSSAYVPEITGIREYYGKRVISYEADAVDPSIAYWNLLRREVTATEASEPPANGNYTHDEVLVQGHLTDTMFMDMEILPEGIYQYRIETVYTDDNVDPAFSEPAVFTNADLSASFDNTAGDKPYLGTFDFGTPNGSGSVEASLGELRYEQSDFTLSNDKLEYGLTRTYASQNAMTSMLGTGWRDSWHQELYTSGSDVYYISDDGSCYAFTQSGNEYICEEDKDLTLTRGADQYTISSRDGTERQFNRFGQIVSVTEPNGYNVSFYYDTNGAMSRVTSKAGMNGTRTLGFTYDSADPYLVTEIELPDETKMQYSFTDGNLTEARHRGRGLAAMHVDYGYSYTDSCMTGIIDAEGNEYSIAYANDKTSGITYPDGSQDVFSYSGHTTARTAITAQDAAVFTESITTDNSGRVTARTGRNGISETITYDAAEIYQPAEVVTTVGYESLSNDTVQFTEDTNSTTTYDYNSAGDIVSEADDVSVTEYAYEDADNPSQPTEEITTEGDTVTEHTEYTYDSAGNILEEDDLIEDLSIVTEYEDGNAVTETTEQEGVETSTAAMDYDAEGNVVSSEEQSGDILTESSMTYDSMGRILTESDGRTATTYSYDYMGRVTGTSTQTEGISGTLTTSSSYDDNGTLISYRDERGAVTTYTYDPMNRLVQTSREGNTTSTAYGTETNVTINGGARSKTWPVLYTETVTDVFENIESVIYRDTDGNTVKEVRGGVTTEYIYDASGNAVVTRKSAAGEDPQISLALYDRKGRIIHQIMQPEISGSAFVVGTDTVVTSSEYDDQDHILHSVNAIGEDLYFSYDGSGRLTGAGRTSSADDRTITYSEDGLTTTIHDAGGKVQTEVQDAAGLTVSMTDSASGVTSMTESYVYDDRGNMTEKHLPDGSEIHYEYDALDRMVTEKRYRAEADSLTETSQVLYTYNIYGDVVRTECYEVSDDETSIGEETLYLVRETSYDDLGRKTSETVTNGSESGQTTSWQYDAKGRITEITYPSLASIDGASYTYDSSDRVTGISADEGSAGRDITYDGYGRVSSYTDDTGQGETVTLYTRDGAGLVTGITYTRNNSPVLSYTYTYDKAGRILTRSSTDDLTGNTRQQVREYTYDSSDRLSQSVSTTVQGNTNSETYSYAYDAAGNRTSYTSPDGTTTYTYNGLNQLTEAAAAGRTVTYTYDANGNLQTETEGEKTTGYTYTPEGTLAGVQIQDGDDTFFIRMRYDENGIRVSRETGDLESQSVDQYYYLDGQMILDNKSDGGSMSYLYAGNELLLASDGSTSYDHLQDIQGSTIGILTDAGSTAAAYDYTDYGETSELVQDTTGNVICYTGAVYDRDTGEYYLNARYYDPAAANFLSQDTYRGGYEDYTQWNLYAYCADDPTNNLDPSGHDAIVLKSNFASKYVGHMAIMVQYEGEWHYFSWNNKGYNSEYMGDSVPYSNQKKYINGKTVYGKINNLFKRNTDSKKYRNYIYLKGDYSRSGNYIRKVKSGNSIREYELTGHNCAWMAINVLHKGERRKNKRKLLYNMLWGYNKGREGNRKYRYVKAIVPSVALNSLSKKYSTKIRNVVE